jgi:hypothetical protein
MYVLKSRPGFGTRSKQRPSLFAHSGKKQVEADSIFWNLSKTSLVKNSAARLSMLQLKIKHLFHRRSELATKCKLVCNKETI